MNWYWIFWQPLIVSFVCEMKRKNKPSLLKRLLKAMPVLLGIVVVTYAGILIKDIDLPTVLPVSDVQVDGELKFLDKKEIEALVKENISGGYFTVNLSGIRELLLRQPWVKNVSLRRKWPASLNIFIEEHVPVAYWNDNAYLGEKGDVFKPAHIDKRLNLPALNGPLGQHYKVWRFMNVLYRETALLNYEVIRLNLDERRAWQLIIAEQDQVAGNQIKVRLGRFDTEKRLQRFVHILPALRLEKQSADYGLAENKIKIIDMRYPNGFAVQMATDPSVKNKNIHSAVVGFSESIGLLDNNNNNSHHFVCLKDMIATQRSEA
ncbi:MAG TPA: FtsQ-type POTRA domain-containing protein [Gammaproteobacteria bacterium]|nr:FtsQ-type POTRA domain-containing protein [Gammaproteobacteria bacterium]